MIAMASLPCIKSVDRHHEQDVIACNHFKISGLFMSIILRLLLVFSFFYTLNDVFYLAELFSSMKPAVPVSVEGIDSKSE